MKHYLPAERYNNKDLKSAYEKVKKEHPECEFFAVGETDDVYFFIDNDSIEGPDEHGWYSINKITGEDNGLFFVGSKGFLESKVYRLSSFERVL